MPMLLSGPAGGGKSQHARGLLDAATVPTLAFDFQSLYSAILLLERMPDGRYPNREPRHASYALPMAEHLREVGISAAREREIDLIVTNSTGDPERRAYLLSRLGPSAREVVLDPGISTVRARLAGPGGVLSDDCNSAIRRWYGSVSV